MAISFKQRSIRRSLGYYYLIWEEVEFVKYALIDEGKKKVAAKAMVYQRRPHPLHGPFRAFIIVIPPSPHSLVSHFTQWEIWQVFLIDYDRSMARVVHGGRWTRLHSCVTCTSQRGRLSLIMPVIFLCMRWFEAEDDACTSHHAANILRRCSVFAQRDWALTDSSNDSGSNVAPWLVLYQMREPQLTGDRWRAEAQGQNNGCKVMENPGYRSAANSKNMSEGIFSAVSSKESESGDNVSTRKLQVRLIRRRSKLI